MNEEIEKLAKELWAIFDEGHDTKWEDCHGKYREKFMMRARHLISMGYRKEANKEDRNYDKDWFAETC